MRGISGCQDQGAYSIVLSGGYEDDVDLGETLCESLVLVSCISGSFTPCVAHTLGQVGDAFLRQALRINFLFVSYRRTRQISAFCYSNGALRTHVHMLFRQSRVGPQTCNQSFEHSPNKALKVQLQIQLCYRSPLSPDFCVYWTPCSRRTWLQVGLAVRSPRRVSHSCIILSVYLTVNQIPL
jgi:hypothetical protein